MADVRSSWITLEDLATQAGVPLHQAVDGDTATGRNAHGVLPCLDSSGNLRYIRQDSAGAILVTTDGGGLCKRAGTDGTPVAGNVAKTQVAELSLTVAKTYRDLAWTVTNFRDTIYEIELIDDPAGTPSVVQSKEILVGAGDLTDSGRDPCFEFDTTGLTSPVLRLSGTNLNKESDFRGSFSIKEDAGA